MKTQIIIASALFFGLSFGASAQGKVESKPEVCPPVEQSVTDPAITPYSVEEDWQTSEERMEMDKKSSETDVMPESEPDMIMGSETEATIETEHDTDSRIESAASSAGSAVKSGAQKTGSAVKKGGKAVIKGAKKTGNAVGSGAKEGFKEVKQHTPGTDAREQHKEGNLD